MVNKRALSGIYSALVTPMYKDESVNYDMLRRLVTYQLSKGVEGFYCCGSSGEALLLSIEERKKILETVIDTVQGRVPIISHVGTIRTAEVIELAEHAKASGVAAVSMIPPYYYRFTQDEILGYYEDVIKAVPHLSVIIYNIPQFTGISFNKDNISRLLQNPYVVGIKHTSQDLYGLERMRSAYPGKIYFNGFDEMFLAALSMGVDATIGTTVNLYPELFLHLRACYYSGDMQGAQQIQHTLNSYVEAFCNVGIFNATKYVLSRRGMKCGVCRSPFRPMSRQQQLALEAYLQKYEPV